MISERSIGAVKPTAIPHFHEQIKPQRITGMCIGHNIAPISGICPVKKGRIIASAKNSAENTSLVKFFLLLITTPFRTDKKVPPSLQRQ